MKIKIKKGEKKMFTTAMFCVEQLLLVSTVNGCFRFTFLFFCFVLRGDEITL
jgi:hypothetical protein